MIELLPDGDRILEYRAVLSARISILLERRGSKATAHDIKRLIFERDDARHPGEYFADLVTIFSASGHDLDALLPVIQDAWNYFPHRALQGRCPAEVMNDLVKPRGKRRRKVANTAASKHEVRR